MNRRELILTASTLAVCSITRLTTPALGQIEIKPSPRTPLRKIAIGIIGQSNEQNSVHPREAVSSPGAFQSQYNRAVRAPQHGTVTLNYMGGTVKKLAASGGMWFTLYDRLWELGFDAAIVNGAIGSASMVHDFAGSTLAWRPNAAGYFKKRAPLAAGEYGDAGSVILAGSPSRIFRCIEGRQRFALFDGNAYLPGTNIDKIDYIKSFGHHKSGGEEPDWNKAESIGDTLTDGELIWRFEAENRIGLHPAATGRGGFNQAMGHTFFDPLGLLNRLTKMLSAIHHVEDRWVILQNGQSDYGGTPTAEAAYSQALQNITQYFLDRGFNVAIGLSCYTPTQSTNSWDGLDRARKNILERYSAEPRVQPGANLYRTLGTDIAHLLQDEQVHLNAEGAIAAGNAWGKAFTKIVNKAR